MIAFTAFTIFKQSEVHMYNHIPVFQCINVQLMFKSDS